MESEQLRKLELRHKKKDTSGAWIGNFLCIASEVGVLGGQSKKSVTVFHEGGVTRVDELGATLDRADELNMRATGQEFLR